MTVSSGVEFMCDGNGGFCLTYSSGDRKVTYRSLTGRVEGLDRRYLDTLGVDPADLEGEPVVELLIKSSGAATRVVRYADLDLTVVAEDANGRKVAAAGYRQDVAYHRSMDKWEGRRVLTEAEKTLAREEKRLNVRRYRRFLNKVERRLWDREV